MPNNQPTKHPEWATRYRKPGTELRYIRGRYYIYEYKTVYDKEKKGPRKISGKMLGSITEKDGFKPSAKRLLEQKLREAQAALPTPAPQPTQTTQLAESTGIQCKEYGMANLLINKLGHYRQKLQEIFAEDADQLLALAYCRLVYQSPLKNIAFRLEASFLPEMLGLKPFAAKKASAILHRIGGMRDKMVQYMKSFVGAGEHFLFDLTHIFSKSQQISLAQTGYNSHGQYDPQFNLLYIHSAQQNMPVYYRLLPGNIREVKAFKNSLLEAGLTQATIIADKGFHSADNVDLLIAEGLNFILPVKRNNSLIDYSALKNNSFEEGAVFFSYLKKVIWAKKYTVGQGQYLYLFLDNALKTEEQKDYLLRVEAGKKSYTMEKFHHKKHSHGTLAMLSNLDSSPASIYQTYKSRGSIEGMFDTLKNVLDADHTYMQNEQTLQGWMFANHIAMQWYYSLYEMLKEKELLDKTAVTDCLKLLTDVKQVRLNGQWCLNEWTSGTQKLLKQLELQIPAWGNTYQRRS